MTICRTSGMACVAAALALAAASAEAKVCSNHHYVGVGSGTGVAELNQAKNAARTDWINKVEAALGDAWSKLNLATGKDLRCERPGVLTIKCTFRAYPCRPGYAVKGMPDVPGMP